VSALVFRLYRTEKLVCRQH